MADEDGTGQQTGQQPYVFTVDAVRRAMDRLKTAPAHEHFAGYLALLAADRKNKGGLHRSASIKQFHYDYLEVPGLKAGSPFFSPVRNPEGGVVKPFNKNIAGSYAPSSLRADGPFVAAVDVKGKGQGVTYQLQPDHENVVSGSMLGDKRIQAIALAAYLLRDHGMDLNSRTLQSALDLFRDMFGLRASYTGEAAVFEALFDPSLDGFSDDDLVPAGDPS